MKNNSLLVVAFMGVDGSGKSTIIKNLKSLLDKKYDNIIINHLKPNLFGSNRLILSNYPHSKPLRSSLFSLLKIIHWLIIYKIFFFMLSKEKTNLILFDRYANDVMIDKRRYRYNLSSKITEKILNYFPQPDMWVVLNAELNILRQRKKEVSIEELKRQTYEYMNFYKSKKNALLLDTTKSLDLNLKTIINEIIKYSNGGKT